MIMRIFIWIVVAVLALLLILALTYFIFLVRPRKTKKVKASLLCEYAHRGLHGRNVPENSLLAFELACRAGYGIELDIQLSKDGQVMVFHDFTLVRMTGHSGRVNELDCCELVKLKLAGTEETIPTFSQVLDLVNGRVPLLVELKGETFDTALCKKAAQLLASYQGEYCIESFNPLLLRDMGKYLPTSMRGILYTNVCKEKRKYDVIHICLTLMAFNFLAKPAFVAFDKKYRRLLPVKITTGLYKAPKFVWTIKTDGELAEARGYAEKSIFEKEDK